MIAQTSDAVSTFGGLIGLCVGIFVIILAIAWLIFPFIVVSKFNQIIRELRKANAADWVNRTLVHWASLDR